jgi:hypothetical protein
MCVYRIWLVMDGDGPLPPLLSVCVSPPASLPCCSFSAITGARPHPHSTDLPAQQEKCFRRALPCSLAVLYLFLPTPAQKKPVYSARIVCSSVQLTRLPPAALTPRVLPSNKHTSANLFLDCILLHTPRYCCRFRSFSHCCLQHPSDLSDNNKTTNSPRRIRRPFAQPFLAIHLHSATTTQPLAQLLLPAPLASSHCSLHLSYSNACAALCQNTHSLLDLQSTRSTA